VILVESAGGGERSSRRERAPRPGELPSVGSFEQDIQAAHLANALTPRGHNLRIQA
jgi:hypothetical protein